MWGAGAGCGVQVVGCRVSGFRFQVSGFRFRVQSVEGRYQGGKHGGLVGLRRLLSHSESSLLKTLPLKKRCRVWCVGCRV